MTDPKPDVNALVDSIMQIDVRTVEGFKEKMATILIAALSEREGDCPKPHVPVYLQSDKYAVRCVQCHAEIPVVKQPIAGDPEWKPIPAEARMACGHYVSDGVVSQNHPVGAYCRTCKQQAEAVIIARNEALLATAWEVEAIFERAGIGIEKYSFCINETKLAEARRRMAEAVARARLEEADWWADSNRSHGPAVLYPSEQAHISELGQAVKEAGR